MAHLRLEVLSLQSIQSIENMASSSALNTKSHFHARSNSLPSRPHPIVSQIDEKLCRLKPTESTSSSICNSLNGLADLYDLVNNLLLLPLAQQGLAEEFREKQIDEVLDRSLTLMDVCGITRDALLQIKEDTQELQSILRRRGDEARLANKVGEYFSSRKMASKAIHKSLRDLKSRCKFSWSSDNETAAIINILREVEGVTITVFESLLSYTSAIKAQSKPKGWSLVSKLMQSKRISREANAAETNEFEIVDTELNHLIHDKTRKSSISKSENAITILGNLELSIQDIEERLVDLQRGLIKTRVSLLNIINH